MTWCFGCCYSIGWIFVYFAHSCFLYSVTDGQMIPRRRITKKANVRTDKKKKRGNVHKLIKSIFSYYNGRLFSVTCQGTVIFMKMKTFTQGREHLHPFMQKDQKQKQLFFHRKDSERTLYCGFFTTSDLCSVVHLVINNGYCGKASKGLLRFIYIYTHKAKTAPLWAENQHTSMFLS